MIDLYVYDLNFNLLGEISQYEHLYMKPSYYPVSELVLTIEPNPHLAALLQIGNIITTQDDKTKGYIIQHFMFTQDEKDKKFFIEVFGYSLNYVFNWRTISPQMRASGSPENIVKQFINKNAIEATSNRIMPNLRLASNHGISGTDESMKVGGVLLEHITEICMKHEMACDVLLNHVDRKFDVVTWQGTDRSKLQSIVDPIVFDSELENILNQQYVKNLTDYKNTAVVAGEGEGANRKFVTVNDSNSGFNRREVFVDARDLQQTYYDDNNQEITISNAEYLQSLSKRGNGYLTDFELIESVEGEVDNSQFIFGVDYFLGDCISFRNRELGYIFHPRITSVEINCNNEGTSIKPAFGTGFPTFEGKIKKKVKR